MSFKIFSLQLLGKIKPVEQIENKRKSLQQDYEEFLKVEASKELERYLKLENLEKTGEFKRKKAEVEAIKFKGSREDNQLKELAALKKSKQIRNYFKVAGSSDLKRFESIKDSDKLKSFYELEEYVKQGQYDKEKKEIKSQMYKGSVQERHWKEFVKLDKSAAIKAYHELDGSPTLKKHESFAESEKLKEFVKLRNEPGKDKEKRKREKVLKRDPEIKSYFKFEKSKKLKFYRETADSHDLKRYYELKEYVGKEEFKERVAYLKDGKKFEKSETYKKKKNYDQLASDPDTRFFLKYEKSALHKNYLDTVDSFNLKRYNELVELTESKEFLERKAYLEDTKKWEKTEEYAMQKELHELKKEPRLVRYFGYKGTTAFDFIKNHEVIFEEHFEGDQLDLDKWSYKGFLAEKMLGSNYSLTGDMHVFTEGDNVKTNGKLTISVQKKPSETMVWKMPAGFIPATLDYTSGNVSSWNSFWLEDGIVEAKVRFNPMKEVVSTITLSGEENSPRINLLEMGLKNRLGVSEIDGKGKVKVDGIDVSNLKKGKPYILSVERVRNKLTWKINETTVLQSNSPINGKLHINANTIVVNEILGSHLPIEFEIYWIKCYQKK